MPAPRLHDGVAPVCARCRRACTARLPGRQGTRGSAPKRTAGAAGLAERWDSHLSDWPGPAPGRHRRPWVPHMATNALWPSLHCLTDANEGARALPSADGACHDHPGQPALRQARYTASPPSHPRQTAPGTSLVPGRAGCLPRRGGMPCNWPGRGCRGLPPSSGEAVGSMSCESFRFGVRDRRPCFPAHARHSMGGDTGRPCPYSGGWAPIYGWALTPRQVGTRCPAQRTPVRGLYLAGQWTSPVRRSWGWWHQACGPPGSSSGYPREVVCCPSGCQASRALPSLAGELVTKSHASATAFPSGHNRREVTCNPT